MLTGMICFAAMPASAAGGLSVIVCGLADDGRAWALGIYDDFEEAWNDAVYYSVNLEETWNSAERYETEEERENGAKGFVRVIVDFYDDWNAVDGVFGSGYGFKDGALYVPSGAHLTVNLGGHTINSGSANNRAIYIDADADITINGGTIRGEVKSHDKAKTSVYNVYAAASMLKVDDPNSRFGSIFGEGSILTVVAILTLIFSGATISIVIDMKKKISPPMSNKSEGNSKE